MGSGLVGWVEPVYAGEVAYREYVPGRLAYAPVVEGPSAGGPCSYFARATNPTAQRRFH
jgi:hypothetical protein